MKINVLGTDYEVVLNAKEEDYPDLKYGDGYCDFTIKKIVVAEISPDDESGEDLEFYQQKVIRHEVVHAFMYESGLDVCSEWGRDETLIDWIAIQSPKLFKAFEKATEKSNLGNGEESSLTFDSSGVSLVSENITLDDITQIDSSCLKESKKEIVVRLMLGGKDLKYKLTGRFD